MLKACLMNQATDVCKYGNSVQTQHHEWDTFCCVKFTRSVSKQLNKKQKNIYLKKMHIKKKEEEEGKLENCTTSNQSESAALLLF